MQLLKNKRMRAFPSDLLRINYQGLKYDGNVIGMNEKNNNITKKKAQIES